MGSPKGVASATTCWDLEGEGEIYHHDAAQRLLLSEKSLRAASAVPNNTAQPPADLESIAEGLGISYTPTEHMSLQAEKKADVLAPVNLLPPDGSGRNRPGFANGKAPTQRKSAGTPAGGLRVPIIRAGPE